MGSLVYTEGIGKHNVNQAVKWCKEMVQQAKRGRQFEQQAIEKCKRVLAKSKGGGKGGGGGGKGKSSQQRDYIKTSSSSIMEDLNVKEMQQEYHQSYKQQFKPTQHNFQESVTVPSFPRTVEPGMNDKDMRIHCNKLKEFLMKRGTHLQKYESDAVDQCQEWRNHRKAHRQSK